MSCSQMADVVVNTETQNSSELLGQGIRAYVLQDYNAAVTALSKASELMTAELGTDLHDSLGEVYLYYGKALLGLSREENEALGDAVPKGQEESDDDEEEEAEETDEKQKEQNGETEKSEKDKVKDQESKEDKTEEKAAPSGGTATEGASTSNGAPATTEDAENEDDEPTDLQVAWEVLELAKKVFEKQGDAGRKNLADTLIVLGEIALESENFPSAINDIKAGLAIQKTLFSKESRVIAESLFKLGVAYSTNSEMDEAIASFADSLKYLRTRVEHLEKMEDKKDEVDDEIKEIRNLIPEVEEKIADIKSYKEEVCQCDIRTTIKNFVCKPTFESVDKNTVNKLQVKKKTVEEILAKVKL
ncbi:unnamed protein product [Acanthoscelides obtectus]|uniref:Tetratricopeptide SHNi-TPR domain-containing protein n=2 Tax=Acanthoscelides obtectus TaxID=200917 RepID=A0A9P0P784_ACAOB|nr:unnamed protein product [Acanthoscelides obtectus]CAK1644679.1 Nuclear autoantigenic sperm protein [Acanthoscelides obtectus]